MIYGLGGYQQSKLTHQFIADYDNDIFVLPGGDDSTFKKDEWIDGWTVGAGLEVFLTKNISFKGEYRFSQLNGSSLSCDGFDCLQYTTPNDPPLFTDVEFINQEVGDTYSHAVKAVLSFWLN